MDDTKTDSNSFDSIERMQREIVNKERERRLKDKSLELAARSMEINNSTLPEILKNADEIYQWLIKTN